MKSQATALPSPAPVNLLKTFSMTSRGLCHETCFRSGTLITLCTFCIIFIFAGLWPSFMV